MRSLLVAIPGATVVATILAAGGGIPTVAAAEVEMAKCIDCIGYTCHTVHGAASRSCTIVPEGCIAWGECG
jgi:hypothetical protein